MFRAERLEDMNTTRWVVLFIKFLQECDVVLRIIVVYYELLDTLNPHKLDPLNNVRNLVFSHGTYS